MTNIHILKKRKKNVAWQIKVSEAAANKHGYSARTRLLEKHRNYLSQRINELKKARNTTKRAHKKKRKH